LGRAAPAVGVQAERPQRSEDEQPGRRRGWRDAGCGRGRASVADVWLSGSVFMYAEDQQAGPGVRGIGKVAVSRRWAATTREWRYERGHGPGGDL